MKPIRIYRQISTIIPENQRMAFRRLCCASLAFSLLDLISIAYLVPALVLLLDQDRLNEYLPHGWQNQTAILIGVSVLVVFYLIKNLLQAQFNNRLYQFLYGLSHQLSMNLLDSYLKDDYVSFQQRNKGTLIQNTTTLTRDFSVSLLGSMLLLFSEAVTFAVIVGALLFFYPKLTLIAILSVAIFAFCIYRIKKSEVRLINETYKDAAAKSNAELLNILDGYIEIKSSGRHDAFLEKFRTHHRSLNQVTAMLTASTGNYSRYLELFLVAGIAGLVALSVIFVTTGHLVLLSVLGALSIKLLPSLSKILNAITMVNSHFYSLQMLNDLQKTKAKPVVYASFQSSFELREISFAYVKGQSVLENIDCTIEKGKIIGIKGITGAGKTTFLHIASGLLNPTSGSIFIDGVKTNDTHFFRFVGYVSQQPFLFNGTVLENISMREEEETIDREYIDHLAKQLELSELIANLPNGLDTVITHNTSKLSGGQKQRLALLRALYHRPELLILDEATNQQNEALERKIYDFLQTLTKSQNLSVITVSHSPTIADFCDRHYELEKNGLRQSILEIQR